MALGSMAVLRHFLMLFIAAGMVLAGCDSTVGTSRTKSPAVAAPAVTQASWVPDALEELLAPIALYPDALLAMILAASVNSQEILDGGNWLLENQSLTSDALDSAAATAGFGPAMRALLQFPTVVDMLCQEIEWTRRLGSAFTADQKSVLDAVQRLRAQAVMAGNLKSTPEQTVATQTDGENEIVAIRPADPQVVYVPQYNPQVVYTAAPPASAPAQSPATTTEDTVSKDAAIAGGLLAFGLGVVLGNALDDDDCYPHWGSGAVYYGPRPFYPPAYVYRPVYGRGLHPAHHYTSPPGYRHAYNNVNVNRKVVVNNDTYFNRFTNNQSPRADGRTQPARESWKGQAEYADARGARAQDQSNAASRRPRADEPRADSLEPADRGRGGSTRAVRESQREAAPRDSRDLQEAREPDGTRELGSAREPSSAHDPPTSREAIEPRERADNKASIGRAAPDRGRASTGGRESRASRRH
jgi:hypothetical protein